MCENSAFRTPGRAAPDLLRAGLPVEVGEAVEAVDVTLVAVDEILQAAHHQLTVFAPEVDQADAAGLGLAQVDDVLGVVRVPHGHLGVADVLPCAAAVDGAVDEYSFDLVGAGQVDAQRLLAAVTVVFVENDEGRLAE